MQKIVTFLTYYDLAEEARVSAMGALLAADQAAIL
jgi:hypothetical protein